MPPPATPTTLSTYGTAERAINFQETFVTEALNRRDVGILAPGVYQGLLLAANAAPYTVDVTVGSEGASTALYQTSNGYLITIRRLATSTLVIPVSYDGTTVVLCLYATYSVGAVTTAELRVYTQAQYDASADKPYLVVLGTITVPVGGVITSAQLSYAQRTYPAERAPEGLQGLRLLTKNPTFEQSSRFWARSQSAGDMAVAPGTTGAHLLTGQAQYLGFTRAAAASTGLVEQRVGAPISQALQIVYELKLKAIQAATAGTFILRLHWKDAAGVDVGATSTLTVDLTAPDASTRTLTGAFAPPATAARLWKVALVYTGLDFGAAGLALVVNSLRLLQLRRFQVDEPLGTSGDAPLATHQLDFVDATGADAVSSPRAQVTTQAGETVLELLDRLGTVFASLRSTGRLLSGSGMTSAADAVNFARLAPSVRTTVGTPTLLLETVGVGRQHLRVYYIADNSPAHAELRVTLNAFSDASVQWTKDVNGEAAYMLALGAGTPGYLQYRSRDAAANGTWADNLWSVLDLQVGELAAAVSGALTVGYNPALAASAALAATPRFLFDAVAAMRTGHTHAVDASGDGTVRSYVAPEAGSARGSETTINARWDGTNWVPDNAGVAAFRFVLLLDRMKVQYGPGGASWAEAAWVDMFTVLRGANSALQSRDAPLSFNAVTAVSNPTPVDGGQLGNTLYASNVPKAWGRLASTGAGPGAVTIVDGFNIASATVAGGGTVSVTFVNGMADANFAPLITPLNLAARMATATISAGTGFSVKVWDAAGVQVDLATVAESFFFVVFGKQS